MKRFTVEPMAEIIGWVASQKCVEPPNFIRFAIPFNRNSRHVYAGEIIEHGGMTYRHRTFQNIVDLADATQCNLVVAEITGSWLHIELSPRSGMDEWHHKNSGTEKYGSATAYQRIQKLEDPSFLSDFQRALKEADVYHCHTLLDLGVNTGEELKLVYTLNSNIQCTGIDHCESALRIARSRFISQQFDFINFDINNIEKLYLKRYDILLSLGTLHSPGIDSKRIFMWCVQQFLNPACAVIIGFPNCRWIDGQPVYGGKLKNRNEQDLSLIVKDVYFIKKYLQQHRFTVKIFGKYYLFVVGMRQSPPYVS